MSRTLLSALAALVVTACANMPAPEANAPTLPRELLDGRADMVIRTVEPDVSREEIADYVRRRMASEVTCLRWPALWSQASGIRTIQVRYDMMTRDWGDAIASDARQRLDEFVETGLLTKNETGVNVTEYTLTETGRQYLRGELAGGAQPPSFCGPAERRLVEITALEWGEYPCGSVRVAFSHVADDWPSWITSEGARQRLDYWQQPNVSATGAVTLGRHWYRETEVPADMNRNGGLRSLCYDSARRRSSGDDFRLVQSPQ